MEDLLRTLPAEIKLAGERGLPVVYRPSEQPPEHALRLMAVLGVAVEVQPLMAVVSGQMVHPCPHAPVCDWKYLGTATRAEGFLERHLRQAHAPGVSATQRLVTRNEEQRQSPPTLAVQESARPRVRTINAVAKPPKWPRERIADAIKRWASIEGSPPTSKEWKHASEEWPSASMVKKVFGSWANAVEAAGFPRPRRGTRPGSTWAPRPSVALSVREPKERETPTFPGESPVGEPDAADVPPAVSDASPEPAPAEPGSRTESASPEVEKPEEAGQGRVVMRFGMSFDLDYLHAEHDRYGEIVMDAARKRDALAAIIHGVERLRDMA